MPRPRKYPERGVTLTAYVSRETYDRIRELARSKGTSVSEVVEELLVKGLGAVAVADPPDPPGGALHTALKGLEPLERERVLQFIKKLDDAEARLAKLGTNVRLAKIGRPTLLDVVNQQEVMDLKGTVVDLKHAYEKKIKRIVRDPTTLNMIGERLLRLMKELGVSP
jgi:hypothetical protein